MMNPGYLSYLLLCIIMILLASGWKKQLIKGVSDPFIVAFLISWIILSTVSINVIGPYRVNLFYLLLIGITFCIIVLINSWADIVHLITVGLLVGASYVLLNQLLHLDPVYILLHPYVYIVIGLSLITAILIRPSLHQIAVITIGLLVGDLVHTWLLYQHIPLLWGTARFYDLWWLLFLGARLISVVMNEVWRGCKQMLNFWLNNSRF